MKNKSIFSNKLVKILISVVVSFILWLYVITVVSPGSEIVIYNIPVQLYGESVLNSNELMLAEDYHFTVDLRLAGNRIDLNQLNNANIKLSADLTNIVEAAENQPLSIRVDSFGDLPSSAISVLKKSVDEVLVTVVPRREITLTIQEEYADTRTPENFDKRTPTFDHSQITVYGPAELIDQVKKAVVNIDLTGRTETFTVTQKVELWDENNTPVVSDRIGIVDNVDQVTATVPVVMYKELPLWIETQDGGGATGDHVQIDYFYTVGQEEKTIDAVGVWGPKSELENLQYIKLDTIDLAQVDGTEVRQYDLNIPAGMELSNAYGQITAKITVKDLAVATLQVTNIQTINPPEGVTVTLRTDIMSVVIRGPQSLLQQVTPEDITIVVDLSNAQEGTATYNATVQIVDNFSDIVGAVGNYPVTVNIT